MKLFLQKKRHSLSYQQMLTSLVYLLLYTPILVLILYSFNQTRFSLAWHGFTLMWYKELMHDSALWLSFLHSVILALSAAFIATITGLMACIHLFLHAKPSESTHQKRTLIHLMLLLIIIPDLIVGIALLIFFNITDVSLGFFSLLIAHVTFCIPFVVLTISGRINLIDPNVYYSALDLGATHRRALTHVLLPLLWPAVVSAILLCFTLSFDDVMISYFVSGPDFNILPLTIFSLVRAGVTPELNALCTITLLISMVLVILSHRLSRAIT